MTDKPKILMVDNAKIMHGAVKARLTAHGAEFHSAYSGDEGLKLAKTLRPDLILLDVEMPSPNGFEVCRRLKNDPSLSSIPVIFLTAAISTEEKIAGLNLGAIDYVTKPFDAAELQARVRSALRVKELLDLLSTKAMVDGLTGLWNRAYLDTRLKEELASVRRRGGAVSCIMLDVDHFKSVNDTHGHGFGDAVLKSIGKVIQEAVRSEDVPCRYGGEEFAILARDTTAEAAMILAHRIREVIASSSFCSEKICIKSTCSLGVADSTDGADTLLERADRALYESKKNGRDRVTLAQASAAIA